MRPAVVVTCCLCAKLLRGAPTVGPRRSEAFSVRRHKNELTGRWCPGVERTDHVAVPVRRRARKR